MTTFRRADFVLHLDSCVFVGRREYNIAVLTAIEQYASRHGHGVVHINAVASVADGIRLDESAWHDLPDDVVLQRQVRKAVPSRFNLVGRGIVGNCCGGRFGIVKNTVVI